MPRPLSKNQAALVATVERTFAETRAPVPFATLRELSGVPSRFLTSTVASVIDRGLIVVAERGVAAYLPASARPTASESGRAPCPMGCDGKQNPPCPGCYE